MLFKSIHNASIVLGAGFGDEGKGTVVNSLCEDKDKDIVIRFSGGQQAGHTVVNDKTRHVFSSYGSGTLKGVSTYISEHCTIDIEAMLNEYNVLIDKDVKVPTIMIHPLAKITTPWDIESNRMHHRNTDTCGMGVGKTMKRNEGLYKLHAIDLLYPKLLEEKLYYIKKYYNSFGENIIESLLESLKKLDFTITDYNILHSYTHLIFEGSQGIMLDMDHGTIPHVTYANTTSKNALDILEKSNLTLFAPDIYYVTRCYLTRHGEGWMPNECKLNLKNNEGETNQTHEFQGKFRKGILDYDMLNYAFNIDNLYSKSIRKNIVVTCLDQFEEVFTFDIDKINIAINEVYSSFSQKGPNLNK